MLIKFTVQHPKPRNLVAAASPSSGAGTHRPGKARQQARLVLRRELALLERPPHRP